MEDGRIQVIKYDFLVVINTYWPCREEEEEVDKMYNVVAGLLDELEEEGKMYYMCGDLNAWYERRCGRNTCRTGRLIEDLIRRFDLVNIMDTYEATFTRGEA